MKKIFKILLVLFVLLCSACSNTTEPITNVTTLDNKQIQVKIPKALFVNYSDQEIIDEAKTNGVVDCRVENDLVYYVFDEEGYQQMLIDLRTNLDNMIQSIHDHDPSIIAISYAQDFKMVKIRVDQNYSKGYENLYAINVVTLMSYYQIFKGYEEHIDIHCEIIDENTYEVIAEFDYRNIAEFANSLTIEEESETTDK